MGFASHLLLVQVLVSFPLGVALHVAEEWPGFPRWARRFASAQYSDREYITTHVVAVCRSRYQRHREALFGILDDDVNRIGAERLHAWEPSRVQFEIVRGGGMMRATPCASDRLLVRFSYSLCSPRLHEDDSVKAQQLAERPGLKRASFWLKRRLGIGDFRKMPKAKRLDTCQQRINELGAGVTPRCCGVASHATP